MRLSRLSTTCAVLICCVALVARAHEGHDHADIPPDQRPTNFNDPKFAQNEAHLKEHLKDEINMKAKMSPEEMEFHYFRLHDTNNDTHLDGIEILQAMAHMIPVPELTLQEKLGKSNEAIEAMMDERRKGMMKYYEDIIDRVLRDDDIDKDGYLTYSEFARARRREEYHSARMHEEHMRQQAIQYEQFQQWQAMQAQQGKQGTQMGNPNIPPPPQQMNQMNQQQQQQFQQFQQYQLQQQQQQQNNQQQQKY
ncbi:multiple coagulation factor deficiency protein 2 homolog [Dreissena polymorpha]|nr:multiple coagulation factor deficiency protein 2 homolog isoform X2 [Dreissena polymorpha]XP_052273161.1 multiple coagulation factor deficiency protein 2 homolog isoform X2 [Dreissena polymorpha]XP_052273162.1 multiple coagulation factor deficiency protein 2 homolog [Dreissena polymorpha]